MKVIHSINQMFDYSRKIKGAGKTIGFVPTMGALHQGHLSLIKRARGDCQIVVVSIFVNPAQFGPGEDFKRYPRNFVADKKICQKVKVDFLFAPRVKEIYPQGYCSYVRVKGLEDKLCGVFRPGYFQGVTTIVHKLFNVVQPDIAYFGQKDFQQAVIIKRMVRDLNIPVKIRVLPIVREKDGLAMSSRNKYLNRQQRKEAPILFQSLQLAKEALKKGERNSAKIISRMKKMIERVPEAKIDYVSIVDPETLEDVRLVKGRVLVALAVRIGKARLIDNIITDSTD
ncbi:MAG: pantoate--beta-alanine ligase [Candidatus Omnitrophica bacterium 4484_213]|nr:MAG: pantoate--beta-alanine ligase [Candidatus Omnitrophica bacterium 4484_213]